MTTRVKCTHNWGTPVCDSNPVGILLYVPRGERIPRIDVSCEAYMNYHWHHGGIAVIDAIQLLGKTPEEYVNELKENREDFLRTFLNNTFQGMLEEPKDRIPIIQESMEKGYDSLVEKIEKQ